MLTTCYSITVILFSIGLAISTLEFLYILPCFREHGVYSWRVISTEQMTRLGLNSRGLVRRLLGDLRVTVGILVLRLAAVFSLPFLDQQTFPFAIATGLLVLTMLTFTMRRYVGDDGSDQMNGIITLALFLCAGVGRDASLLQLGIYFIAFQACLSYFAAGVAKAISPEWRDGSAIFKIFNTEAYGIRCVAEVLAERRWLNLLLAWTVIAIECCFPLVVVLPMQLAAAILVWGVIFHLLNAVIMGLNSFFWAFTATYPAIVFVNLQLHGSDLLSSGGV